MTDEPEITFASRSSAADIEQGGVFQPKFDADGLIAAIVTDRASGAVLMFAHMNADALSHTLQTGFAHFWSRSRRKLWKKGEDSGNVLLVREVRTDCDQDVVWIIADVGGDGVACHTGRVSCFYRRVDYTGGDGVALTFAAPPKSGD